MRIYNSGTSEPMCFMYQQFHNSSFRSVNSKIRPPDTLFTKRKGQCCCIVSIRLHQPLVFRLPDNRLVYNIESIADQHIKIIFCRSFPVNPHRFFQFRLGHRIFPHQRNTPPTYLRHVPIPEYLPGIFRDPITDGRITPVITRNQRFYPICILYKVRRIPSIRIKPGIKSFL